MLYIIYIYNDINLVHPISTLQNAHGHTCSNATNTQTLNRSHAPLRMLEIKIPIALDI